MARHHLTSARHASTSAVQLSFMATRGWNDFVSLSPSWGDYNYNPQLPTNTATKNGLSPIHILIDLLQ